MSRCRSESKRRNFFWVYKCVLTVEEKVAEIARKRRAIIVVMRAPNAGEAVDKLRKIPGYENTEEKDLDKILADPAHNLERGVVFTLEGMKMFVIVTE